MQDIRPTSLIIFGATGDLATRKLYPALLDLYLNDFLPTTFQIVGFSRKPFTHEAFRAQVQSALDASGHEHTQVAIRTFLEHVFYVQGDIDSEESYGTLRTFLEERDAKTSTCSNKLFYLAVPPTLYKEIFEKLSLSGLAIPCAPSTPESDKIWTRVLVEKPFGNNQDEAKNLDLLLGELFEESQIFRIDHYLGKETVQNIVAFRFSNSLLEPVWNAEHVEKIEIRVLEKGTAANRGAFYEGIGALADVGQNHLLQMLALSTMEIGRAHV